MANQLWALRELLEESFAARGVVDARVPLCQVTTKASAPQAQAHDQQTKQHVAAQVERPTQQAAVSMTDPQPRTSGTTVKRRRTQCSSSKPFYSNELVPEAAAAPSAGHDDPRATPQSPPARHPPTPASAADTPVAISEDVLPHADTVPSTEGDDPATELPMQPPADRPPAPPLAHAPRGTRQTPSVNHAWRSECVLRRCATVGCQGSRPVPTERPQQQMAHTGSPTRRCRFPNYSASSRILSSATAIEGLFACILACAVLWRPPST